MELLLLLVIFQAAIDCTTATFKLSDKHNFCVRASFCAHNGKEKCGLEPRTREVRRFLDECDILEFNCEYKSILLVFVSLSNAHGPPQDRDNEDIAMGRKVKKLPAGRLQMGAKWCSSAKVCNHDRVPVCGVSHAGDVMGFRDLCDMFDFNCIRRRNYKQVACPEDKSMLTASRRPTNTYSDY